MAVDVDVTIDGFNKYIAGLNEAEVPSYFKLIMFNSHEGIRSMTRFLEVSAVPGLSRISYRPSGGTPLLDAVGEAIALTEKAVIDSGADPGVVVAILTDGLENSSLEYSSEAITKDRLEIRISRSGSRRCGHWQGDGHIPGIHFFIQFFREIPGF